VVPYAAGGNSGPLGAFVARPGRVLVRDTKDRAGAMLSVPADAWRRFISVLK
jgi:hypothetical protein